jgi:hypothetical protein
VGDIDTALARLASADRANEDALIEAAVASGLVVLNDGPVAHSIKPTEAGLRVCQTAARD